MDNLNNLSFLNIAAWRALDLLRERKALLYPSGMAFWVWPRDDRVILIFDPNQIDLRKVNDLFAHELSTRLSGRRVVRTNSRGLFLQVGYSIPLAPSELIATPLDLDEQPSPFHLPVGTTDRGPLWISMLEADSILLGGSRGFGKSAEIHGWIQALLHGNQTQIYAWDGKENAEYMRYLGHPNFHFIGMKNLQKAIEEINQEARSRLQKLAATGHPNILTHNATGNDFIQPIALIVDEVAEVDDQEALVKNVRLFRAAGVFPIFATNDPSKASVVAKTNLTTRISFAVPSHNDSLTILARTGANKLPKIKGRGMLEFGGRMVTFQSFTVTYPEPSEQARQWLAEQVEIKATETEDHPIETDREKILKLASEGKSSTAIVRELYGLTGGRVWERRMARVREIAAGDVTTTTTATTPKMPDFGANVAG